MNEDGNCKSVAQAQIESLLERFNTYLKDNNNSLSRLKESVIRLYGVQEMDAKPACDLKVSEKLTQLQRLSICLDEFYNQTEKANFLLDTLSRAV